MLERDELQGEGRGARGRRGGKVTVWVGRGHSQFPINKTRRGNATRYRHRCPQSAANYMILPDTQYKHRAFMVGDERPRGLSGAGALSAFTMCCAFDFPKWSNGWPTLWGCRPRDAHPCFPCAVPFTTPPYLSLYPVSLSCMLQLELITGVALAVVLGFVLFAKGSSKPSPTVADGGDKGAASRGSAPVPPPAPSPTEVGWCMDN